MEQIEDPFLEWLKETFVDPQQGDIAFIEDQHLVSLPSWQMQQVPDTQLLVSQMQAPLHLTGSSHTPAMPSIGTASAQRSAEARSDLEQASSRALGAKKARRPKNTKRYKSVAQKEAHKRYRERKKHNISAMEQEVAEKLQLLQELEMENAALKSKMRVLETSVSCSTEIHDLLQLINGVSSMSLNGSGSYSGTSDVSTTKNSEFTAEAAADSAGVAADSAGAAIESAADVAEPCFGIHHHSSGSIGGAAAAPGLDANCGISGQLQHQQQLLQQPPVVCKQEDDVLEQLLHPYQQAQCTQNQQHQQQQHEQYQQVVTIGLQHGGGSAGTAITAKQEPLHQLVPSLHSLSGSLGSMSGSAEPSSGSSSLHEIFAEAKQRSQFQKLQAVGGAAPAVSSDGVDPLANAISSVEQGIVAYKAFLQRASALLIERKPATQAAAAADQKLDKLTRFTIAQIFQPFLVAKGQGVVYESATLNLETLQHQEPPEDLWPRVAQQMHLSPQQRQDAVACYCMFGMCLSRLVDQRLALTAQYKALQQAELDSEQRGDRKAKLHHKIQSMETLQAISKSLTAYQSLDGVFAHSVTSIISGSQLAVACVHSYPFLPNWHKIAHILQLSAEQERALLQQELAMQTRVSKPAQKARVGRTAQQLGVQHVVKV